MTPVALRGVTQGYTGYTGVYRGVLPYQGPHIWLNLAVFCVFCSFLLKGPAFQASLPKTAENSRKHPNSARFIRHPSSSSSVIIVRPRPSVIVRHPSSALALPQSALRNTFVSFSASVTRPCRAPLKGPGWEKSRKMVLSFSCSDGEKGPLLFSTGILRPAGPYAGLSILKTGSWKLEAEY